MDSCRWKQWGPETELWMGIFKVLREKTEASQGSYIQQKWLSEMKVK